jgi:hypothetical protein
VVQPLTRRSGEGRAGGIGFACSGSTGAQRGPHSLVAPVLACRAHLCAPSKSNCQPRRAARRGRAGGALAWGPLEHPRGKRLMTRRATTRERAPSHRPQLATSKEQINGAFESAFPRLRGGQLRSARARALARSRAPCCPVCSPWMLQRAAGERAARSPSARGAARLTITFGRRAEMCSARENGSDKAMRSTLRAGGARSYASETPSPPSPDHLVSGCTTRGRAVSAVCAVRGSRSRSPAEHCVCPYSLDSKGKC